MSASAGGTQPPSGHVRLRYWASARAAAGVEEDVLEVEGPVTLESLLARAKGIHADSAVFASVLDSCSVLVGDRPVASKDPSTVDVPVGATVEFLPPFAGG